MGAPKRERIPLIARTRHIATAKASSKDLNALHMFDTCAVIGSSGTIKRQGSAPRGGLLLFLTQYMLASGRLPLVHSLTRSHTCYVSGCHSLTHAPTSESPPLTSRFAPQLIH